MRSVFESSLCRINEEKQIETPFRDKSKLFSLAKPVEFFGRKLKIRFKDREML